MNWKAQTLCWIAAIATLMSTSAQGDAPESTADQERRTGFVWLFDGQGLDGWQNDGNWIVEDGAICRNGKGGSLVFKTAKVPDDFELRFEWKVAKGSNSGVYYRPSQYEYQILDNQTHRDGKNPRTSAASLYFCMPPSEDATLPVGQWNRGRIVCKGTVIQHWLNGTMVVGFDYTDPRWSAEVELLRQRGGDLDRRGGYLSLQDHGDPVWYRNIRWRVIDPSEPIDQSTVTPQALSEETQKAEQEKLAAIIARRNAPPKTAPSKE